MTAPVSTGLPAVPTAPALPTARYVPDVRITVNGHEIPGDVRSSVLSVRYDDGINAADRVEIELANAGLRWLAAHVRGLGVRPYPTGVRLGPVRFADGGPFDLGNQLSLALGYADAPLADVFAGEITGLDASFPSTGTPTLTLVAHDHLYRLGQGNAVRGFGLLPDFLVAAILGAENLLVAQVDPLVAGASTAVAVVNEVFGGSGRAQTGQSDLELLGRDRGEVRRRLLGRGGHAASGPAAARGEPAPRAVAGGAT